MKFNIRKNDVRPKILDDFKDLTGWTAITSGEAQLNIFSDRGRTGKAMGLEFDFRGGGGFVVARKEFQIDLPEDYSFFFHIRGRAPSNIFEFKLVDDSNLNVWRYRVESFAFPEDWRPVRIRGSQIDFAWGPLGGGAPRRAAAVELVIAAGPGGKGRVWIDDLSFQDDTYRLTPLVRASSARRGHGPKNVLNVLKTVTWRGKMKDHKAWILIDFKQEREYGGLSIDWEPGFCPRAFDVELSNDKLAWRTAWSTVRGGGERSHIYLPGAASRYVRLKLEESVEGRGFGIQAIHVRPCEFSRSLNHFFEHVAREYPVGLYPKYLSGQQTYWTVVGTGEGDGQALFNEEGMVEAGKGTFSIVPFIFKDGRLFTWADAVIDQQLRRGDLPIPSASWRIEKAGMKVTAFARGEPGKPVVYIRYRLENPTAENLSVVFFTAILPFQVTPVWQHWRSFGGVSPIRELTWREGTVRVNGRFRVIPLTEAGGFGAAAFDEGGVTARLKEGRLPSRSEVRDQFGFASGALRFDLELAPHSHREVYLSVPMQPGAVVPSKGTPQEALEAASGRWASKLDRIHINLPPHAQDIALVFKTAAAHILINREGPGLHPGPRRYTRSWIRDGAIMGAALMRLGHTEPLRDFLRWYKDYQAEDGNLPDCVDGEGAEWLPEFDAPGEFIYAVMEVYRFTGDASFLEEMGPAVERTLSFMERLRRSRITDEFREPEKRAFYGLLPESMSHEGYMAHPVHAYWDDFWALRGLRDAAMMARVRGLEEEAMGLINLADTFSRDLRASLRAAIDRHGIDYIPGSVELGDFDPAATAIAISLLDQLHLLPRPEADNTFERFMAGFRERVKGGDWNNYSAYEIRIIGALTRLGKRREAQELTRFMLADRRIPPWNQWPEISWRDPSSPSFMGDLPHTWISAEYILAISSMLAYERGADRSLVLASGVDEGWLRDGFTVVVENLPTYYGSVSYRMGLEGEGSLRVSLEGGLKLPPGGAVVEPPLPRSIREVEVNGRRIKEISPERFVFRECPAEAVVKF